MAYASKLTTTDWNEEWKSLQQRRSHFDDPAHWDARAKTFPTAHGSHSSYADRFLALAAVEPGQTVLDMGCGTGVLATPLAQAGCKVVACDFSRGMLDAMEADQRALGVKGVKVLQISWDDDWPAAGLGAKSVDVALASRSIATYDLGASLDKLTSTARKRACVTLPCGPSPKISERLLQAAGLPGRLGADFLYAFNILADRGINPEVAYIPSSRQDIFDSPAAALDRYRDILIKGMEGIASEEELQAVPGRLRTWLDDELVQSPNGWTLRQPLEVTWAFIAWDCAGR